MEIKNKLQQNLTIDEIETNFSPMQINLLQIGFFSVADYNIKKPKDEKTVKISELKEKGIEARVEIATHPKYGLPTVADLTKYIAFLELLFKRKWHPQEKLIRFTHYELLKQAGLNHSKANYDSVTLWLKRMRNTEISFIGEMLDKSKDSEQSISVFNEIHISGSKTAGGEVSKTNTVWLSDYTIQHLEKGLLKIDKVAYQKLNNNTAKLLAVQLQVWLFAARKSQFYQKRYSEFCQVLGIKQYKQKSKIIEKLQPAFNCLQKGEYVEKWNVEPSKTVSGEFIIKIWHGKKFYRDLKEAFFVVKSDGGDINFNPKFNSQKEINARMEKLGLFPGTINKLFKMYANEEIVRRLDLAEEILRSKSRSEKIINPSGFIASILMNSSFIENVTNTKQLPVGYENSDDENEMFLAYQNYINQEMEKLYEDLETNEREEIYFSKFNNIYKSEREKKEQTILLMKMSPKFADQLLTEEQFLKFNLTQKFIQQNQIPQHCG